jgi:signal transduction histidine kinase
MNRARRQFARWPLILAVALLGAALGAALWLRSTLVEGQDSVLEGTARRFTATKVLGRPEMRTLDFSALETLAEASENSFIRRIHVTKRTELGAELTVHPFFIGLTNPNWKSETNWLVLPVGEEEPVGFLYVDIDNSRIRAVNAVLAVLGTLLAGGLGILILQQRGQEVKIVRMSDELEARKAQVIHLEKLALAGQLSANIFHDIKKPVLNIKHEVTDALDGVGTAPEQALKIVQEQTELFLQMLREVGMESFVNATRDEREWCDLAETIRRSENLVRYEQEDVKFVAEVSSGEDCLIHAVPYRLVQLFSNLFLNAYQAMGGNGELRVSVQRIDGAFSIEVHDSGPGIPKDLREELFSPFVTTRAGSGGSGLGLYICRTIVEDLGGSIEIRDSNKLGGACFLISLPKQEHP